MSLATVPTPQPVPVTKYRNVADLLDALGGIPAERVVMDPLPGTATEADVIAFVDGDNKRLVELVNGTLVEKTVGLFEALIAMRIGALLTHFVNARNLGMVFGADATLRMATHNVRLPDVSFISFKDIPAGSAFSPEQAIQSLPPTLAVEVISRGNTKREMKLKLTEYFASGTRLAWLIYPKTRTVAVYEGPTEEPARILKESDILDGGNVLPGFATPLADLFKPPQQS